MKIAFIHDHPFWESESNFYSQGGLPANVWSRYLDICDEIVVVGRRLRNPGDVSRMVLSSRKGVSFKLVNELRSPVDAFTKRNAIVKRLKIILKDCDGAIVRLPSELGYLVVNICRQFNIPYLLEVVGCPWNSLWNYGNIYGKLLAPLSYIRMKRSMTGSSHAIYVTNNFLQKRYPSKGKTVGVSDVDLTTGEKDDEILKARLARIDGMTEDQPIKLGLIGSLVVKYKGHAEILRAIKALKGKYRFEVYFVGPGDGEWIKSLSKELGLENECHILYRLKSGAEIFKFLDNIDIYTHPSKQEGLPRVVVEALSRACPVLASSIGGIPELVDKSCLHTPGDYKKLAEQLAIIAQNHQLLKRMAVTNFEKSKEFDVEILNERRRDFLQEFEASIPKKESNAMA